MERNLYTRPWRCRVIKDFNVIIERDSEGYYVASVPALRGCHTQAKSLDTLMERVREVVELCLEVEERDCEISREELTELL